MFPCTNCGECCRNISHISELKAYDNGNGICIYLCDDNSCGIYDIRPTVCSIDRVYDLQYKDSMSKFDFYVVNRDACNAMQKLANIDKKFRVIL